MSKVWIVSKGSDDLDSVWTSEEAAQSRHDDLEKCREDAYILESEIDIPSTDAPRQFWFCQVDTNTGEILKETADPRYVMRPIGETPESGGYGTRERCEGFSHVSIEDARVAAERSRQTWIAGAPAREAIDAARRDARLSEPATNEGHETVSAGVPKC